MPRWLLVLLTLSAVPRLASAQVLEEPAYARTLAMGGAQRALGTSNETLYFNPAGMALRKRYEAEGQYLHGDGGSEATNGANVSIVDSNTGPVAGGLAYTYVGGGPQDASLHRVQLGFAVPISESLAIGISGRHIFGHFTSAGAGRTSPSLWSGDLGLLARVSDHFQVGVSSRNLLRDERTELTRRDVGAGLAYIDEGLALTAETDWDLEDKSRATAYRIGGEYVAGGSFPLRLGYAHQPFPGGDESVLSGGAGIIIGGGGLNVGYAQSLSRDGAWKLSASVAMTF